MHYTILVVDDQQDNLQVLAALLTEHGLQSRCVTNGAMAIRTSLARPPALVLLDIKMPGMDGYEVCRQLKVDERTRNIPIIFLSALDETQDKVKAFAAGGVDYVTKPFQPEEVMARVQTHLALRELQIKLEAIVAERTRELREAYAKLEAVSQARTMFFAEATRGLLALLMSIQQYQSANPADRADLGDNQSMFAKSVSYLQVVVSDMIAQTERATSRDFPGWLAQELESRDLSMSELARRCQRSVSTISRVLSGEQRPGANLCEAIARSLNVSVIRVFWEAGLPIPIEGKRDLLQLAKIISES